MSGQVLLLLQFSAALTLYSLTYHEIIVNI